MTSQNFHYRLEKALQRLPDHLYAHLEPFSKFLSSRTRSVCGAFHGYIRGLFQASRGSLLRMSEVVDTDSQALHHLLTEAGVDWDGLSGEVAMRCSVTSSQR